MPPLTSNQQEILRWIVDTQRAGQLEESFEVEKWNTACFIKMANGFKKSVPNQVQGILSSLAAIKCLHEELLSDRYGLWRYTITGPGEELVKRNFIEPAPVPSQVSNVFNTTNYGGANQIGTHNQMEVKTAVETIAQNINNSTATPEQKAEAKGALARFLEHPAVVAIVGALASGAAGEATK